MKLLEPFYLSYLAIKVKIHTLIMYLADRSKYYKNKEFKDFDRSFIREYWFRNPYTICKKHMISRGATDTDVYGETPLSVYKKIIDLTKLSKRDQFIELGCGRGRGLFFVHYYSGCSCEGIEFVDKFCEIAKELIARYGLSEVKIKKKNFFRCNLSNADVIYLCSTLLTDQETDLLSSLLLKSKKDVKIITTSFPLCEYSDGFKTIEEFEARFLWGKTSVYVNTLA
ncbi:MAG: hypothetical protein S4CHLAM37_17010 [Chlamydiia bacterium]|nr:hypothetical protein [Chlamydiia bacterium]